MRNVAIYIVDCMKSDEGKWTHYLSLLRQRRFSKPHNMWIFCTVFHLSTVLSLILNTVPFISTCYNGEYEINGQCCPMCDPGKRVYKHCDMDTSITCVSCAEMTYTDSHNGFDKCMACSVCDTSNGVKVKKDCTVTSNTVCEPLPGHYCIDLQGNSCIKSKKHSTCSPGQYINQTGTAFQDTVCADCPVGSYSDGTLCKLHTNCEALGKTTSKPGTKTSDTECSSNRHSYALSLSLSLCAVCLLIVIIVIVVIIKKKKEDNRRQHYSPSDHVAYA